MQPISSGSREAKPTNVTLYLEVPEVDKRPISSGSSGKANKCTAQYLEVHIMWSMGSPSVQGLVAKPTTNASAQYLEVHVVDEPKAVDLLHQPQRKIKRLGKQWNLLRKLRARAEPGKKKRKRFNYLWFHPHPFFFLNILFTLTNTT